MAKIVSDSQFLEYEFTEEELKHLPGFTPSQKQFLQNELAIAVSEKVALTIDPLNVSGSLQREAEIHGKIGILKYLLSLNPKSIPEI